MKKIAIILAVCIVIAWVLKEIFLPNMGAAKIAANEYGAYFSCRTIHEACEIYKSRFGAYPENLAALAKVHKDLARERIPGYSLYLETVPPGYVVRAVPLMFNRTGRYMFQMDESGTVSACDKNGECETLGDAWHPPMPSMPYPYKPGDGAIE